MLQYRIQHEYGADILVDKLGYTIARWVVAEKFDAKAFDWEGNRQTVGPIVTACRSCCSVTSGRSRTRRRSTGVHLPGARPAAQGVKRDRQRRLSSAEWIERPLEAAHGLDDGTAQRRAGPKERDLHVFPLPRTQHALGERISVEVLFLRRGAIDGRAGIAGVLRAHAFAPIQGAPPSAQGTRVFASSCFA